MFGIVLIGTAYALVVQTMLVQPASYVVSFINFGIVLATFLPIGIGPVILSSGI